MASKKLSLEAGGPQRLELTWGMFWKNFRVVLDGKEVGTVTGGAKELKQGVEFSLPDGTQLRTQLIQGAFNVELQVLRDGVPLPGSASDPEQRIKTAAYLLYFLAGLNTVLGVVAAAFSNETLEGLGMGIGSILFGAIVAVLGFFTYRRTRVAPILAIVLYALDTAATFIGSVAEGGRTPPVAGIFVRVYIFMALVKAVQAANELARREKEAPGISLQP